MYKVGCLAAPAGGCTIMERGIEVKSKRTYCLCSLRESVDSSRIVACVASIDSCDIDGNASVSEISACVRRSFSRFSGCCQALKSSISSVVGKVPQKVKARSSMLRNAIGL